MERGTNKTPKTKSQTPTLKNTSGGSAQKRPIKIVPDANLLFGDLFFRSVTAQTIIAAVKFTDIKLVVGDITIDELRNIAKERLDETVRELNRVARKAEALELKTGIQILSLGYESKQAMEAWEKRWASLREVSPALPYPKVDVKDLARSSINQCRPFLKGDKGLRDYLLWISILKAARDDDCTYILVTNDHGFYDGNSDALHPDMQSELASHSLFDRVMVRRSFAAVVDEFVKPLLKPEQIVEVAIRSGQISDFTDRDDTVALVLDDYLAKRDIPDEWITKSDYYSASFDVVEDVTMASLTSTLELDGTVLVTSEWEASVVISLSCPGYQEDSETVIVSFTIESLVNPNTLEVESHEVSDCSLSGWYDEETGERVPY